MASREHRHPPPKIPSNPAREPRREARPEAQGHDRKSSGGGERRADGGGERRADDGGERRADGGGERRANDGDERRADGTGERRGEGGRERQAAEGGERRAGRRRRYEGLIPMRDRDGNRFLLMVRVGSEGRPQVAVVRQGQGQRQRQPQQFPTVRVPSPERAAVAADDADPGDEDVASVAQAMQAAASGDKEAAAQAAAKSAGFMCSTILDSNACKICYAREIDCVLLNCGHLVSCEPCARKMKDCPICQQRIHRVNKIFKT